jgi:hypothetical protein
MLLVVGHVMLEGWNVGLMYGTVLHSLQGSRGHVSSDHFVYLARSMSSDCAMLVVSSQVATSMGYVQALRLAYLAFRFSLSFKSSMRGHDSFVFLGTAQPNFRLLTNSCLLALSFSLFVCSLARFPLTLLFLASPNLALRLNMNLGDNNDLSTAKRSCRTHRKSRKGCADCKARRVKVPQTRTIPTASAMRHISLF